MTRTESTPSMVSVFSDLAPVMFASRLASPLLGSRISPTS
ncbi:Uncharacterised protein [Mycobacteroides abscessus subsp. abscessus]|nr:Uncharacterised protein [Mycobacteroides abscessus subsp. abscessus]